MRSRLCHALCLLILASSPLSLATQPLPPLALPQPQTSGGKPLMQALAARHTARNFSHRPLSRQMLSNLLWAAFGVNRPRSTKPGLGRTAPSAMNQQEIELHVVLPEGVFLYDAEAGVLRPMLAGDLRGKLCPGEATHAPVTLFYVADIRKRFAQVDTGFIAQNVYLFAASEGLHAWFYALHGAQDADAIAAALRLPATKRPLFGQSIGFPPP